MQYGGSDVWKVIGERAAVVPTLSCIIHWWLWWMCKKAIGDWNTPLSCPRYGAPWSLSYVNLAHYIPDTETVRFVIKILCVYSVNLMIRSSSVAFLLHDWTSLRLTSTYHDHRYYHTYTTWPKYTHSLHLQMAKSFPSMRCSASAYSMRKLLAMSS